MLTALKNRMIKQKANGGNSAGNGVQMKQQKGLRGE